jgi:hypothetical protein
VFISFFLCQFLRFKNFIDNLKEISLCFFNYNFLFLISLISALYYLLTSTCFWFILLFFCRYCGWELSLLICDVSCFSLAYAFSLIKSLSVLLLFLFIHNSCILKFPLIPSFWPVDYLEMCCLVSKYLEVILLSFTYWFLVWFHCDWSIHCIWLKFFHICSVLFHGLGYNLSWYIIHRYLKRRCILLLLAKVFNTCNTWLDPVGVSDELNLPGDFLTSCSINGWEEF